MRQNFDKDELDVGSEPDLKNKKDALTLRLVYNDSSVEELSLVKQKDDKDDYIITSNKDKLKVKFTDDDSNNKMDIPQSVIDHIAKHIEQAEENNKSDVKNNDSDLASQIAYNIKMEFPNYDMEVIEGDVGSKQRNIQIVYPNGDKDSFTVNKIGKSYIMRSKDLFVGKFTLDELKNFLKK